MKSFGTIWRLDGENQKKGTYGRKNNCISSEEVGERATEREGELETYSEGKSPTFGNS
jgi:hypothetical protein